VKMSSSLCLFWRDACADCDAHKTSYYPCNQLNMFSLLIHLKTVELVADNPVLTLESLISAPWSMVFLSDPQSCPVASECSQTHLKTLLPSVFYSENHCNVVLSKWNVAGK